MKRGRLTLQLLPPSDVALLLRFFQKPFLAAKNLPRLRVGTRVGGLGKTARAFESGAGG